MKIDYASCIEGYESMTAEQKLEAIGNYELPDSKEGAYKAALDKASSEVAEYKRKLKEKETAEETKAREQAEKDALREAEFASLKKTVAISQSTAQFIALGYDAELAKSTAEAQADGDTATVLANQKAFIEKVRANERAAAMNAQHRAGGENPDIPDLDKMSDAEYYAFKKKK